MREAKPILEEDAKGNNKEQEEPLLTTREAAALLRVHPKQIYRLLKQGLPGLRVGGEWRLERASVLAWASHQEIQEPPLEESPPAEAPPLVAANGDVVVRLLLDGLPRSGPLAGFVQTDRGGGLDLLRTRRVLAAGVHDEKPPSKLGNERLVLLYLAEREVGLVFSRGASIRGAADVVGRRVATRPKTAGVRRFFDAWRVDAGVPESPLTTEYPSHEEVVLAVARGEAEVGIATGAWALRAGLGFLPLASEPYALALTAASLGTALGVALCETAQGKTLRRKLAEAGGYTTSNTGVLRFEEE